MICDTLGPNSWPIRTGAGYSRIVGVRIGLGVLVGVGLSSGVAIGVLAGATVEVGEGGGVVGVGVSVAITSFASTSVGVEGNGVGVARPVKGSARPNIAPNTSANAATPPSRGAKEGLRLARWMAAGAAAGTLCTPMTMAAMLSGPPAWLAMAINLFAARWGLSLVTTF